MVTLEVLSHKDLTTSTDSKSRRHPVLSVQLCDAIENAGATFQVFPPQWPTTKLLFENLFPVFVELLFIFLVLLKS
jgi:hypothetical protein